VVEARMKIGPAVLLNDFLCCDKFDIMDKVQNIKLPTLVICGTADDMTPVKYANYLADKIAGSVMVVIDGGTHAVFREKPKAVNQAIENFLARIK
jgi:pimeloyl-ACP methyl ester carboxylesterase